MRKSDLDQMEDRFKAVIGKELQPVRDMALSVHQTLHGTKENPETGLVYEFGAIKRKVWKLTAITNLVTGLVSGAITYFTKGH